MACAGGARPATPRAAGGCATGEALAAEVAARLHTTTAAFDRDPACTAGRFPQAGHVLEAWLDGGDGEHTHHLALVVDDRVVVDSALPVRWQDVEASIGASVRSTQAVDFDGDGIDERLMIEAIMYGGAERTYVEIARLTDGAWQEEFSEVIAFDDATSGDEVIHSCTAGWRVEPEGARRVLVIEPQVAPARGRDAADELEATECPDHAERWTALADGSFGPR